MRGDLGKCQAENCSYLRGQGGSKKLVRLGKGIKTMPYSSGASCHARGRISRSCTCSFAFSIRKQCCLREIVLAGAFRNSRTRSGSLQTIS